MPTNPPKSNQLQPDQEEQLAQILEKVLEHGTTDQSELDLQCRQHPELETELRQLWATAMLAQEFGNSSLIESPEQDQHASDEVSQTVIARYESHQLDELPSRIGSYEIIEELGRGGMGVVYKAKEGDLHRDVALKMLLRHEHASPDDLARFRSEAVACARLQHPNIVAVHDFGVHAGQPYFSMEYIEGQNLSKLIQHGPLDPRHAARLLIPVCRAIAEAHRHGILHRDLKPSNILLDEQETPYVSDFGLAKRVVPPSVNAEPPSTGTIPPSITHTGAVLGTPSYMAPEQAMGQRGRVSTLSDVYSLGAILYASVTGLPPFQAASAVDIIFMVLEQDPIPPRLINRRVDSDLEMIILKCLQKPADLRYDSADALADDLEAYLANESITARSSHFFQVLSRAFRSTHHVSVLENWGLLWMWHALVLFCICLATNALQWSGLTSSRLPYAILWTAGLTTWAFIFWSVRRRAGPVTFVERQIAHVWAGSVACSILLYGIEGLLGLEPLTLSPVLALEAGVVFLVKAGILSGEFYVQAIVLFATAIVMCFVPDYSITLMGIVTGLCFFIPGLKFYRLRRESRNDA